MRSFKERWEAVQGDREPDTNKVEEVAKTLFGEICSYVRTHVWTICKSCVMFLGTV